MGERDLTYRALVDLTRARDPEGRGVTYAYLWAPPRFVWGYTGAGPGLSFPATR